VIEPQTPEWVRDTVFYQIFPDRFAKSSRLDKPSNLEAWDTPPTPHGYKGGDLLGVSEQLDYLSDLGINAIYFTPIFQSASNHRYHTHDYLRVDPMLGGNAALRTLIDNAHAKGIKIVLDGVFNHASRGFFPFHDILENGQNSAYLDWFDVHSFPPNAYDHAKPPGYGAWWNLHALPKFNIRTKAVRNYLFKVAKHWIDFGIDGWRLDVANEIEDDTFWQEFRQVVHAANPQAYIVGEVWHDSSRWLKGDMWDAVMNYLFTRACIAFFIGDNVDRSELQRTTFRTVEPTDASGFQAAIESLIALYHPSINAVMMNLLSSHDMTRFLNLAKGDVSALRLATIFQMTYTGAPSIYYGDEIALPGAHDPDNRAAFPWNHENTWNHELFADYQRLIALRKSHQALRRGSFIPIHSSGHVFAYLRQHESESFLIALNASNTTRRINIDVSPHLDNQTCLRNPWSGAEIRVDQNQIQDLEIPPRTGLIFGSDVPR
jgi:neopullulanase